MAKSIARNLADVASPSGVVDGTLSTAAQTNITSVGTLSSLTISGNLNATLTTAAQTNITSLGTLSSLNLSGALTGTTGTFTTADNLTQVRLISTDADASIGPRLDLFRNSASPAAGDFTGRIRFLAEDSAGNETAYVHFDTLIDDPTDGSEDGQLRIETKVDGSMIERITIDSTETVINDNHANLDFRIESDAKANAFFIEGTTGKVGINTATPYSNLDVSGSSGIYVRHSTGGSLVLDDNDTADGSTPMVYLRNTAGQLKLGYANRNSGTGLTTGSTDSMTISATGDAHFTGNVEVGNDTNISMDGSASGQLQVDGNGYSGAIALDGTAMYVYHNSNGRALVLGTNETTAVSINGANQDVSFSSHIDLPDSKYVKLGDNDDMLLYHNGSASYVQSATSNLDIIFRGNDGGTGIDAMYLDMSAGGVGRWLNGLRPQTDGVGALGSSTLRWSGLHVKSTEHEGIKFTVEGTTANSSLWGVRVDMDLSGSDTLTTDRSFYGQYITLDSSATGGDTSDEHRLYGLRASTKATGDSDLIYGGYLTGEAEHSAGTVSALYGSYSQASADPESGGTVSNLYGAWNTATVYGSSGSTVQNAYASYNRLLLGATDVVAHNTVHGVMSEIETDASGTARTTASGYLFRGLFDDDSGGEHKFTNFYGLHLSGTALGNRVDGNGTVAGVYLDMAGAEAGFWNSEDQPNYFRGSLGIGSGSRQVGATAGMELHLVEPQGGDMLLARYDGATTTNEVLGRIFFGCSEDAGANVNYNASIEAYAGGPQSTSDSEGYIVFKTVPNNSTTLTESFRIRSDGNISLPSQVATGSLPQARLEVVAAATSNCINTQAATAGHYACFGASGPTTSGGDSYRYGTMINSQGSQVGSIQVAHGSVTYNTSSDYRLKENVTGLTDAITRLKQLQPKRFNFIEVPDKTIDGFLAHEVSSIVPEAVTGEKDAVDADGNPNYQGIDSSKLIPLLVAAVQEQQTLIEALQEKLSALENS